MTAATDGRRARGQARRRELVRAALEVIARDGVAGLTHRAVSEQAGVALASASYHYDGIDDLLEAALTQLTEDMVDLIGEDPDRSIGRLARLLADNVTAHHDGLIGEYELYLLAARRPHLRHVALAWIETVAATFAPDLHGPSRAAFMAIVEGICLHSIVVDDPPTASEIEQMLAHAWPQR